MRRIADDVGIEQPGGSFLHQRTHTPDPERSVEPSELQRQVSESSSRSVRPFTGKKSADIAAGRRSTAA
jgi:hypothetical protein